MASVFLSLVPPERAGYTKLHIWEAVDNAPTTAPNMIETVTDIGSFPDYISGYSTNEAASVSNWFSIQWEDDKGVLSLMSARVKGNSRTLVSDVTNRVLERDHSLDKNVVVQEVEGAIQYYLGEQTDPYDPTLSLSYTKLNGLTYLTMARVKIIEIAAREGDDNVTIGLVSMRSPSNVSTKTDVQSLLNLANNALGINTSVVLQLDSIHHHDRATVIFEP